MAVSMRGLIDNNVVQIESMRKSSCERMLEVVNGQTI